MMDSRGPGVPAALPTGLSPGWPLLTGLSIEACGGQATLGTLDFLLQPQTRVGMSVGAWALSCLLIWVPGVQGAGGLGGCLQLAQVQMAAASYSFNPRVIYSFPGWEKGFSRTLLGSAEERAV